MNRFDEYALRLNEEMLTAKPVESRGSFDKACTLSQIKESMDHQEREGGHHPQIPISEDPVAKDPVYQMLDSFFNKFGVCCTHRQELGIDKKILTNIQDQVFFLKYLLESRNMKKGLYEELHEIHEMSKANPLEVDSELLELCVIRYFTRKIDQK